MAGSAATCTGSFECEVIGGFLGVYPGTSYTGNFAGEFVGDITSTADSAACAEDGLAAWKAGRALTSGYAMTAEMGGLTFTPGVYTHASAINIALANPEVYLDADGDPLAVFIFNVGTTLTTCANSKVVLLNGARKENVFWVLGTALTMGADSTLVGNVLAGSAITIGTNAEIKGRAIAQTTVTCATACKIETSGRHSAGAPSEGEEKLAGTWNEPLQAVGGVIQDEYLIYHDGGINPRALLHDLINSGDAEILFEYTLMNAFSVHAKRELLDIALKDIEGVEVFDNPVVSALDLDSPVYAWGVDRTDQTTGTNDQYQYERNGTDVDVYILDTGIFVENYQFEGRASFGADFTGEGHYDGHGHGTHVAGTLH
jgi:hypothetical protein